MLDIIKDEFIKWTDKTFPEGYALGAANHLMEEAEELATELTHDFHDNRISEESKIELADIQMLVWYIQEKLEISDEEMGLNILKKLAINKTRVWKKNPNGSYNHIKKTSFHFGTEGVVNPSDKMDLIRQEAEDKYNELINDGVDYVCLIYSGHWASEGYWVELNQSKVSEQDFKVKEYIKK